MHFVSKEYIVVGMLPILKDQGIVKVLSFSKGVIGMMVMNGYMRGFRHIAYVENYDN